MMKEILFLNLAELCDMLARKTKRSEKIELIGNFLRDLESEEIAPAVTQIIGVIFPEAESRSLEIGYFTVKRILEKKKKQTTLLLTPLTISDVRRYFDLISASRGTGSRQKKESLLESLLGQAGPLEATYLVKMIFGEMQHGVSEGLMMEAIASAAHVDLQLVMRANMLLGDIGEAARLALTDGESGLRRVRTINEKLKLEWKENKRIRFLDVKVIKVIEHYVPPETEMDDYRYYSTEIIFDEEPAISLPSEKNSNIAKEFAIRLCKATGINGYFIDEKNNSTPLI